MPPDPRTTAQRWWQRFHPLVVAGLSIVSFVLAPPLYYFSLWLDERTPEVVSDLIGLFCIVLVFTGLIGLVVAAVGGMLMAADRISRPRCLYCQAKMAGSVCASCGRERTGTWIGHAN